MKRMTLFLLTMTSLIICQSIAYTQTISSNSLRILELSSQPVEVSSVKVGAMSIVSGKEFATESGWLKHLKIRMKNTSSQNIKYICVRVSFPKDASGRPLLPALFAYQGKNLLTNDEASKDVLDLAPLEETDLMILEKAALDTYNFAAKRNYPVSIVNHVTVNLEAVVFGDDTAWIMGYKAIRNKSNPMAWDILQEGATNIRMSKYSAKKKNLSAKTTSLDAKRKTASFGCMVLAQVLYEHCSEGNCLFYTQVLVPATFKGRITDYEYVGCRLNGYGAYCNDEFWAQDYITPWSTECIIAEGNKNPSFLIVKERLSPNILSDIEY